MIKEDRERYEKQLMGKKNVIGVMTARKVVDGQVLDEMSITCLVSKKESTFNLRPKDLIPRRVGTSDTDVLEVGNVKALGFVDPLGVDRKSRIRPAPMGTSGGHYKITAGTNGELLIVRGSLCIGTNNHVGANSNDAKIGDAYLQPGPHDGGEKPNDVIGYLYKYEPINFVGVPSECPISGMICKILNLLASLLGRKTRLRGVYESNLTNLVDAAAIILENDVNAIPEILDIGIPKGVKKAEVGMLVQKSGRTTGHIINGPVTSVDATIQVSYGEGKMAIFTDQIIIGKPGFSAGGDSGSLVLDMDENAIGKLFAGSGQVTIVNHIDHYLEALDAELVIR